MLGRDEYQLPRLRVVRALQPPVLPRRVGIAAFTKFIILSTVHTLQGLQQHQRRRSQLSRSHGWFGPKIGAKLTFANGAVELKGRFSLPEFVNFPLPYFGNAGGAWKGWHSVLKTT